MSINEICAKCANDGDLEGLKNALANGADVDFQDEKWGWSPLFWAVYANHQHIVEYLCSEARSNPNLVDPYGKMALHIACKNGNLEAAKFLVGRGSDINFMASVPADSWTPLTYAAHHGWPELVEFLLKVGADRTIQSIHGKTAAELATDPLIIQMLTTDGPVSSESSDSKIEVFISCDQADLELAKKLQADIEKAGFSVFISCPDVENTPEAFDKFSRILQGSIVMLALLSDEYAADPACRKQVNFADGIKKTMITILTKPGTAFPPAGPMSAIMAGMLYQDFTLVYSTYEQSFAQLIPKVDSVVRVASQKEQLRVPKATSGAPSKLIKAVQENDIATVREFIASGVNLNKGDPEYKWPPLFWACYHGHSELVEVLCNEGLADPRVMDAAGKQAIHVACKNGNLKSVVFLVDRGANIDSKPAVPADSWTPLMYAASYGFADIVEFLVSRGADKSITDIKGKTALDYSTTEEVSNILKSSSAQFENNKTDVFLSYNWTHQETVKKVKEALEKDNLKVWMDINQMSAGDSLFGEIDAGMRNATAVVSMVTVPYSKSLNCIKEIRLCDGLKKPVVVVKLDSEVPWPPEGSMAPILGPKKYIDMTSEFDSVLETLVQRVKTLCSQQAPEPKVNRGVYDAELFSAAEHGDVNKARAAIQRGADPNVLDEKDTWSPLMWAVYGNHHQVVEYLCKEGRADVNLVDKFGKQALHVACKNGRIEIVKYLVERGANVNFMVEDGRDTWPPIFYAINYSYTDIVIFLIQCGADLSLVNAVGTTAASLAADKPDIDALLQPNNSQVEIPLRVDANVFLTYFGAQLEIAKRVKADLEGHGISVWMDEGQFGKDDVYYSAVDYGLRSCQVVLPIISDSFSAKSQHQKEMNLSDGLRKKIVSLIATPGAAFPPIGIMGPILAAHPSFDLSSGYEAGFSVALQTIKAFIQNPK